jgi:phenylpropionate dioxygenase-like ring-hydroxylating dioxygenase large terminal subunit
MALDRALLRSFEESVLDVNRAWPLAPECYVSEEFFQFEKRAIFDHDWICVGHEGQIPNPGDFVTLTLLDEPLLVVRGKDGTVRVMSAVCRHRGMIVAEGSGNCNTFRCPYHFWTYDLDGRFLAAPAMERRVDFDKSEYVLPQLKVETWNRFIFANFDDEVGPFAPTMQGLDEVMKNFQLMDAAWVDGGTIENLPWNWKVMHENFNDGYHNNRLHQGIGDVMPCDAAEFIEFDENRDNHITRSCPTTRIDSSFNPTWKAILPIFPHLTEHDRWRWIFALVPPTLALAVVPDEVAYFTILPKGANEISIQIGYLFDPHVVEMPMFEYLFEQAQAGVNNFNVQDIHADTMVQKGLRSRFAPRGPYSWQEETLQQFNRWLVKRYRAEAERQASAESLTPV